MLKNHIPLSNELPTINKLQIKSINDSLFKSHTRNTKELMFPLFKEHLIHKDQINLRKTEIFIKPNIYLENKNKIDLLKKHKIPLEQKLKK